MLLGSSHGLCVYVTCVLYVCMCICTSLAVAYPGFWPRGCQTLIACYNQQPHSLKNTGTMHPYHTHLELAATVYMLHANVMKNKLVNNSYEDKASVIFQKWQFKILRWVLDNPRIHHCLGVCIVC